MKKTLYLIFLALIAQTLSAQSLFKKECKQHYFSKDIPAGNYSGITYLGNDDYAVVSDKSANDGFFVFNIVVDRNTGEIRSARNKGFYNIGTNNGDLEAVTYDSDCGILFLCSEENSKVVGFDVKESRLTEKTLDLSLYYKNMQPNGGIESFCLDKESKLFWTINEKPLKKDAPLIGGYVLRLKSFDMDYHNIGTYAYRMDYPNAKNKNGCIHVVGVSEIAAIGNGTLLILEREFYVPKLKVGAYCICKLYSVCPCSSDSINDDSEITDNTRILEKEKVAEWKTSLSLLDRSIANYEGMCLGPELDNGSRVLILVADSQNQYRNVLKDWFKSVVLSPINE